MKDKCKILVVDDEPIVLEFFQQASEMVNIEVAIGRVNK